MKSENKTKATEVSVKGFIDALPDETKRADAKKLVKLMQRVTGEKPKMWGPSIIGFGSYHYKYETGREGDMPVACFSPRKAATVIYGFGGLKDLLPKLGKYKCEGGCVHIKRLADVDEAVLEELVAEAVTRLREKHSV